MKLENMKDEFPRMPEEMRIMIEKEVYRQMDKKEVQEEKKGKLARNGGKSKGHGRISRKQIIAVAVAATVAVGTTVLAGSSLYRLYLEKEGTYGVRTGISAEGMAEGYGQAPEQVPVVKIQARYLPEGMVMDEHMTKMYYQETPYVGGVSMLTIAMDQDASADSLQVLDRNVLTSETLTIGGHDAVYLERQVDQDGSIRFDKMFYVAYPEVWQVLQVFVGQDVTKEEALKIVEHTELVETGETTGWEDLYTWSDYAAENQEGEPEDAPKLTATREEMGNTHLVGECFSVLSCADTETQEFVQQDCITAEVTEVQIADDFSLLDSSYVDDRWLEAADENGNLVSNTVQYIRSGDGTNTLDEIIKEQQVAQKLVYVTVEYTNEGQESLTNVMFMGGFLGIGEEEDGFFIYDRASREEECDRVVNTSVACLGEMEYYDIHGNTRSNNYIPSMAPGETVIVHMAQIVNEDELGYLYLNLNISGSSYIFDESSLEQGYVDIRQ